MGGRPARDSWALETPSSPHRRPLSRCTPPTASSGRRPPATDTSASSSSASSARRPASPPARDRQRTARRRRRRERPDPRGLREGRLPGADEPGAPRAARAAAGGSPRADHARARHQLPLDRRLGAARGGLRGRASRRARFPLNSHPFTATRLVPGADVLAPGPAALPLPVGLLLRHRLRERRARRAPARNVRGLHARALPGERVLAEQRDRPSQAWAARGRARAGRRGRRAAPQATTGASSSPSSSPRRSSRRPSSSTGATTSTASSSRPRSSSPWASSGAASRSRQRTGVRDDARPRPGATPPAQATKLYRHLTF